MSSKMARRWTAALAAVALVAAGCGDDDDGDGEGAGPPPAATDPAATETTAGAPDDDPGEDDDIPDATTSPDEPAVHEVPAGYDTIQAAVDAASPGELVLVSPGVYEESVDVTTPELTIRGLDRNEVILDGGFELDNGIRVVEADGVTVENMTARNFTRYGFYWTGVEGFRGSFLTSHRNGVYGIYAFDSTRGQFNDSYAAGSADAGFYIGQCYPCHVVIDNVVSEHNGLGYSGTNSGGDLYIVNSTFRNNRAGIVPNSGSYQLCGPARSPVIVGNLVHDNNQADTPAIDVAILAMGNGIVSAGSVRGTIARNQIWDHDKTGIALVPFPEDDPVDDAPSQDDWDLPCDETRDAEPADDPPGTLVWDSYEHEVVGNAIGGSGAADMLVGSLPGADLEALGNCFEANTYDATSPGDLEQLAPCDGGGAGDWTADRIEVVDWLVDAEAAPPPVDFEDADLPDRGQFDPMPDAGTAPPTPAVDVPAAIDVDDIELPDRPAD